MKMTMIKIMTMISMMSVTVKNPLSMGIMLLSQTMMLTLMMNKISNSSWFPMITFIMMIGGMMILFIYMSTVASNKKFKPMIKISMVMLIMMIMHEELMLEYQIQEYLSMNIQNENISMMKIYNKSMLTTILMMLYLILTMISINKIIKFNKGPMRSTN
uniref:NADH dehydrogenase subunit 6 n=1 Tax=Mesargus serrata TaxID=2901391 RepID=A0A8K2AU16_9HEMI|nr:NADH dehydrogenase subunit 6 [Mesargus serrata]